MHKEYLFLKKEKGKKKHNRYHLQKIFKPKSIHWWQKSHFQTDQDLTWWLHGCHFLSLASLFSKLMLTKIKIWSLVLNQISWAWQHPFFWMNKARKVHSLSSHTASSLEDQCRSRDNRKSPVVALWFGVWRWGRRKYRWKEKVVAGGQLRWRISGRVEFRKKWWCQWQCYETRIIWATVSSAAAWATSCIRRAEMGGNKSKLSSYT